MAIPFVVFGLPARGAWQDRLSCIQYFTFLNVVACEAVPLARRRFRR